MSARLFLIALFTFSLALVCAFTLLAFQSLYDLIGYVLPTYVSVLGYLIPTVTIIYASAIGLYALIAFIFVFLYLFISRTIVRPIRVVGDAMHEFAAHGRQLPLENLDRTLTEVRSFVDAFREYTDNVERVHERDMEVSRMKSDFISTAAHQLRTPMTGIRWALEALQKTQLSPDQQALIDSAVGKSHDLVGIVGTLLDISSIESGKYHYKFESTDMDSVLENIAHDFEPLAQARKISLVYEKSGAPAGKVRVDVERIKWVLNNLVENAIRYTPADGSIHLTMESGLGRLFIRVRDTGIGIEEGDRTNIFERFYRAQNAIQKENSGNGLGLYIARTIATDHGGDLSFAPNAESPGTTFTLSLPLVN